MRSVENIQICVNYSDLSNFREGLTTTATGGSAFLKLNSFFMKNKLSHAKITTAIL